MTSNTSSPEYGYVRASDSVYFAVRLDGVVHRSTLSVIFSQIYLPRQIDTYKCGQKVAATFEPDELKDSEARVYALTEDGDERLVFRLQNQCSEHKPLAFNPGPDEGLEIPDDEPVESDEVMDMVCHLLLLNIRDAWSGLGAHADVVARQRQDVRSSFPMLGKALDAMGGQR